MGTILLTALFLIGTLGLSAQNIIYASPYTNGIGTLEDPTNIQGALDMARTNGVRDEIRLFLNLMDTAAYRDGPYYFNLEGSDDKDIKISGGWTWDAHIKDPSLTRLSGGQHDRIFYIRGIGSDVSTTFKFDNLTIQDGRVTDQNGGGILVECGLDELFGSNIHLSLNDVYLLSNATVNSGSGGAVYTDGNLDFENCYFDGNAAADNGGAVYAASLEGDEYPAKYFKDCTFKNNSNQNGQGSSVWHSKSLAIFSSTFYGMDDGGSSGNGSCIWGESGSSTYVSRCRFEGIRTRYGGSAIQVRNGNLILSNSLFLDNHAGLTNGYGTIEYYNEDGASDHGVEIYNCTFLGNSAQSGEFAGALHFQSTGSSTAKVYNSLFWDNGKTPIFNESGSAEMAYGITEMDPVGFSMTTVSNDDPELDNEYHPLPGSPAIDAGNNDLVLYMIDFAGLDLDGNVRILNGTVDIGCYEHNTAPTAIDLSNTSIAENNEPFTLIGNIFINDEPGDFYLISLAAGDGINDADNESFEIHVQSFTERTLIMIPVADFEAQSFYHILLKVQDSGGNLFEQAHVINVTDVNEAPEFIGPLEDHEGTVGEYLEFMIDEHAFEDEDIGDALTWSTNTLPEWLDFDANSLTFSGTPDRGEAFVITITVSDQGGLMASGAFNLSVLATAIQDLESVGGIAYPNPASDIILLEIPVNDKWRYTVADSRGAILLEGRLDTNEPHAIYIAELVNGVYFITLHGTDRKLVAPFVKN